MISMINLDPIIQKKVELEKTLSSTKFTSIANVQSTFDKIWKDSIAIIRDQLKYGNKAEKSLSQFLSSLTNFIPSILEMIEYEVKTPNMIQRLLKHRKKHILVVNTELLMSFFESVFKSLYHYINTLPDDKIVTEQSDSPKMDSFAAAMQLIAADIYSFRNLGRMKPENVETTISDLVDAMEQHGYIIVNYDGNNDDVFEIMYANVPTAIMKSPSIIKYSTNEILKKGKLITPLNK